MHFAPGVPARYGLGNQSVGELDWSGQVFWQWGDQAPGGEAISNWVYRALPVSYDWVPQGTPRSETAVSVPESALKQAGARAGI